MIERVNKGPWIKGSYLLMFMDCELCAPKHDYLFITNLKMRRVPVGKYHFLSLLI